MDACSVDPIKSLKTSYHLQYVLFVCLLQMNKVFINISLPKNNRSRKTYEYKFFRKQAHPRKLYALPDRNLSKVKQFMENHIRVEKTNLLHHRLVFTRTASVNDFSSKVIRVFEAILMSPPRHVFS
jgi:hypothetical protein